MNDFTKEELKTLRLCLSACIADGCRQDGLMKKLELMIDNYCEHDWQYNQHHQGHCGKCGVNE